MKMQDSLTIYVGWDGRDLDAFKCCTGSMTKNSTIKLRINPLRDVDMRKAGLYWRTYHVDRTGQRWDDRDGTPMSNQFTYLRYLTPTVYNDSDQWFLFCDPDMLFRKDLVELLELADDSKAVMVVKHDHRPKEGMKMGGNIIQTSYPRKNWASLMLFNSHMIDKLDLSPYQVNMQSRHHLHEMCWVDDDLIGELPEKWNWLEGYSSLDIEPSMVHFTRGTPGMIDNAYKILYADEWLSYG